MGEARRRGSREQREVEAIKRNKRDLAMGMGLLDERDPMHRALKAAFKAFMDRMTPEQWQQRRAAVLDHLKNRGNSPQLAEAKPIRVREDEMGWYRRNLSLFDAPGARRLSIVKFYDG